jgi:hypothetical protein
MMFLGDGRAGDCVKLVATDFPSFDIPFQPEFFKAFF